jgi:hypothetical protein
MTTGHSNFYANISVPAAGYSFSSTEEEISELFESIGKLQEAAMLPTIGKDLDNLNVLVTQLPADLKQLRQRGYIHQAQFDDQVNDLVNRWDELSDQISESLFARQTELVDAANRLLDTVDRLYEPDATQTTVDSCWAGVRALQSRIESAHKSLVEMYDDQSKELDKIVSAIDRVEWMLDQLEAAKFQLYEGEAPVRAAGAKWIRQGEDEGEEGILYLTDQRILFEQKEEKTTEKFLFISVKKETIHELRFEATVSAIQQVKKSEISGGLLGLGKSDALEFVFDHTANMSGALLKLLKDKSDTWIGLVNRVKSGEIDGERTGQAMAEAKKLDAALKEIPTNCPNCSAPIDQEIVRGATQIICNYCGSTIRI